MRLIDADKYCEFLNTYPLEKAQNNFMTFYRNALQKTFECEVKAIPVEWIEDWGWKNGMSESMSLRVMIDDWERENQYGKN